METIIKQYENLFFNWLKDNDIKVNVNYGSGYVNYSDVEIENFNEFVDENNLNDVHDFTFRVDLTVKCEHDEEANCGYDAITSIYLKIYVDGVIDEVIISKEREKELLKSIVLIY